MAKGIYPGINGSARKAKKIYVGVGGVARKVKKVYAGVGGAARLCYSSEPELSYYGKAANCTAPYPSAGATVGNYAIIGAGSNWGIYNGSAAMDAYSNKLVKTPLPSLYYHKASVTGVSVGQYALFEGGYIFDSSVENKYMEVYNASLVKGTSLNGNRHWDIAATAVGDYAIFGGGRDGSRIADLSSTAYAYTSGLVQARVSNLPANASPTATTVGNYALFGARGYTGSTSSSAVTFVISYSSELVQSWAATPTYAPALSTTVEDYALLASGTTGTDTYTGNLVHGTTDGLYINVVDNSYARGTAVGDRALFVGGDKAWSNVITAFKSNLIRESVQNPSAIGICLASAAIGPYALFAGGTGHENIVDVYQCD